MTSTLRENQHTFFDVSLSSSENKMFQSCRENQNTYFMFKDTLWKSCRLRENVEKCCRAGNATDKNIAHAQFVLGN